MARGDIIVVIVLRVMGGLVEINATHVDRDLETIFHNYLKR